MTENQITTMSERSLKAELNDELEKDEHGNIINPFYNKPLDIVQINPLLLSKYEEVNIIMKKFIITLSSGNREVTFCNVKTMIEYFYDRKTVDKTKAKLQLRILIGISGRYVSEILMSLIAWDIIRDNSNTLEYMGLNSTEIDFKGS